jgi:hypothetical protein
MKLKLNNVDDVWADGFIKQCEAMDIDPEQLITSVVKEGGLGLLRGAPKPNRLLDWLRAGPGEKGSIAKLMSRLNRGAGKLAVGGLALTGAGGLGYAAGRNDQSEYV